MQKWNEKIICWSSCFFAILCWSITLSGFYALDGSFSVCTDIGLNVERFSRPLNCVNLCFLGLCASAFAFALWSKACAALGVVKTTICLYLELIIAAVFAVLFLGETVSLMSIIGGVREPRQIIGA